MNFISKEMNVININIVNLNNLINFIKVRNFGDVMNLINAKKIHEGPLNSLNGDLIKMIYSIKIMNMIYYLTFNSMKNQGNKFKPDD